MTTAPEDAATTPADERAAASLPPLEDVPLFRAGRTGRVKSRFTLAPAAGATDPAAVDVTGAGRGLGPAAVNGAGRLRSVRADEAHPDEWAPSGDGRLPDGWAVDWELVRTLRAAAAQQLSDTSTAGEAPEQEEERGRSIILRLLREAAADRLAVGQRPWSLTEQDQLARAVFDSVFRLGRLQPLLDDDRVENIIVTAHDRVVLELMDGSVETAPPVADSPAELQDFVVFLAGKLGREFSEATPRLELRLPDGSRLAAKGWVTPDGRLSMVIRRHRLRRVSLDDLVAGGVMSRVQASFLAAAVRAGLNIVVSGRQKVGKTTLARALAGEVPREHSIVVIEDTGELFLHELPEQHLVVHSWETRPGTGEAGLDGRRAGEITAAELLHDSMRFAADRTFVGEVRGADALVALTAMASGEGGLTTTHSGNALGAVRKLILCVMRGGVSYEYARELVAQNVHLVVHLRLRQGTGSGPRRWVEEILAVSPGEAETGYATTRVFAPAPGRPGVACVLPDDLLELEEYGFDVAAFSAEAGGTR